DQELQRAAPARRRRAVQRRMAIVHELLQVLEQRRAVAAPPGQGQVLAQAPVACRNLLVGHRAGAGGAQPPRARPTPPQPLLERVPLGAMAGDELLLPHRRPSSALAMPYRRCTPSWPVAPVSGCSNPASSAWRAGTSRAARSPNATMAACSDACSGCPGASAGTLGTGCSTLRGATCTTTVSATRSPSRRLSRSHRQGTGPAA